jgi:hypothetical protein
MKMRDELLTTTSLSSIDSFEGFEDGIEGKEEQQSGRIIQGDKVKFTNEAMWVIGEDDELPAGLELVVVNIIRVVQKWGPDNKPIDEHTRILKPGEKWPDIDALNEACPKSEWREGPNGLQGPWQGQRVVYLFDPQSGGFFTWPSNSDVIGARICVNDLVKRTKLTRRYRGVEVYPVITLSDTFMPTRYGGRQRPHFKVVRWITLGPGGEVKQLESAEQKTLDDFANQKPGAKTVTPPTAKEVTDDEIQF